MPPPLDLRLWLVHRTGIYFQSAKIITVVILSNHASTHRTHNCYLKLVLHSRSTKTLDSPDISLSTRINLPAMGETPNMSLTNCRFYEEKYPEIESFVMVNVKQVWYMQRGMP